MEGHEEEEWRKANVTPVFQKGRTGQQAMLPIQPDLDRLERNSGKLNKTNCGVLHLRQNNPRHPCR